jgi:integrase
LRHTWASLHLARGTPIEWVRVMGGWSSAKMLLDVYGHYMPREMRGFSDSLAPADRTRPHQGLGPR